ncbi:hypothetical protein [Modestobacter sp. URMC 112]
MAMTGVPGHDFPEERAILDLLVPSRGDALVSWVEEVGDGDLLVTAGQDRSQRRVPLDPGEHVELVWKSSSELRAMPTELVGVETREQHCWRLRPTGPASRGQRRAAVRAPLDLQVRATVGMTELSGVTVDISEGGFRGVFRPPASQEGSAAVAPPADVDRSREDEASSRDQFGVGAVLDVIVELDTERIRTKAEVVRRHQRDDGLRELSIRFIGMTEHMEDTVRARVFAGLRELRSRGVI